MARRRAVLMLATGRPQVAVESFCEALALEPDDADTHAHLALALLACRRLATARIEAEQAVGMAPETPLPLYALGRVRTAERRWDEARDVLERLLAVEPDDVENHRALAQLFQASGRRADARRILEEARAVDPNHADVIADLAELHLEDGRTDDARRLALEALAEKPEHADALVVMGHLELRAGDLTAAWDAAVSVLRRTPDHPGATALVVAVKARRSWALGLWWRYNTWMMSLGNRAIVVLLVAFAVYRLVKLLAEDFGPEALASLVQLGWLGFAAYTWLGPAWFRRQLEKELAPALLKKEF